MNLKPLGFAAAVLGGFAVNVQIRVIDEGSAASPGGRGIAGSCSSGRPSWPDWPPVGNYAFAGSGNTLLSNGVDPSFYTRTLGGAIRGELACGWRSSRDLLSEHFPATLAGEPTDGPSVRASVKSSISWRNDDQYIKEVRDLIDRQQAAIEKLNAKLVSAGLLSAEERQVAQPTLQVWISDERSKKASALPTLQNIERNVRIIN